MKLFFTGVWRQFKRNKVFTLVNVLGLTIGITCSLVMFLLVKFELSFDRHHQNYDRIYRIRTEAYNNGGLQRRVGVPKPLPAALEADIGGLEEVTFAIHRRYGRFEVDTGQGESDSFQVDRGVVYAEASYFRVFDQPLIKGSTEELDAPNTVVLDESTAKRFFGDRDALVELIKMSRHPDLKVVGIVEDAPETTDFPFSVFVSLETIKRQRNFNNWWSTSENERCYVLLEKGRNPMEVDAQFDAFVDKYLTQDAKLAFFLQPLSEIHFDMLHHNLNYRSVPWNLLYTLAAVCVLMILTACFNFINLSTAIALKRSKEVGVRKVLGSTRRQLVLAFLTETLGITLLALCLSLALAERLLPGMVSKFANVSLKLNLFSDPWLGFYLFLLVLFVTAVAGLYPAWIISGFKPYNLIRNRVQSISGRSLNLRRILIVFQFALSQVFIIGTLIVIWQMDYIKNADLGFQKDQVITLELPSGSGINHADVWHSALEANVGVVNFSLAEATPFSGNTSSMDASYVDSVVHRFTTFLKPADSRYIDTYELDLLAGEGLLDAEEANRYVVNEAFVRKMGFEDPWDVIGKMISVGGKPQQPISGVVGDYHMQTFKNEVKPAVLFNEPDRQNNLGIKLQAKNTKQTLAAIETTWKSLYPDRDFRPVFMEEYISWYYQREARFFNMLVTFAIIAILISCLGLYGMISFIANQRAKEIGIRKVLGASVTRILTLFTSEFAKLVLVAFLAAAPLAYWGMQGWLQDFVYRVEVGPTIYVYGMLTSLLITLFTIGYRSVRAGLANPVDSLRDE